MNIGRGAFIVVEGTDGSGKGTQFKLLTERLEREGYDIETFDFPQYEKPSSYFVREYLNGNYGGLDEVGPYTGSLFYALDRFEAAPDIRKALDAGKIVLANRYVGSSMAHQGTKFQHAEARRGYFIWLDNLEFEMLRIPRADFSFVLRVPPEIAQTLVDQKAERSYTDKKRDLHEADLSHLAKAAEVYDDMCQLFPKDFVRIDCVRDNHLMSAENVHEILWRRVQSVLPPKKSKKQHEALAAVDLPSVEAVIDHTDTVGTEASISAKQALDQLVTSMENDVFAFTHGLESHRAAHVIAQLSQRGDDIRATILAESSTVPAEILRKGPSTLQLLSKRLVVQNASILLSKKLERGRLATYVERASRQISYDVRDTNGHYRYYTPPEFDERLKGQYHAYMDQIFNLYAEMIQRLTAHLKTTGKQPTALQNEIWEIALRQEAREILRSALPAAATTDVAIYASGFALENIITNLASDPLPEARGCGGSLLTETRKLAPDFMPSEQLTEDTIYRANSRKQMAALTKKYLPEQYAERTDAVRLVNVWPRNEFELVPDMLYEYSDLPLQELIRMAGEWTYERKLEVLTAYVGNRANHNQRPGRALEKAHYSWDLLCDFDTFRDLQRHRMVDDLEWQGLTPRYGYEVPAAVDEAELTDQFEACFDLSLRLHSLIQEAGYTAQAQYTTLLGHRLRWKITYNAREAFHLHELRTSPHNRGAVRKLAQAMHEKVCAVHPLLGEAMKFTTTE
jgi:thymidylate kinase/thymidylate synthase ThyX